jgi:hypothetical protein
VAVGGASLGVAAVVAAAIAVPAATGRHVQQAGGTAPGGVPSAAPSLPPSAPLEQSSAPPGTGAPQPTAHCVPPLPAQWNVHLAYQATLSGLLPPVTGTLVDATSRTQYCDTRIDLRLTVMKVTVGNAVGRISANTGSEPGQYQRWLHSSPCPARPAHGTCSLTRYGDALVWTLTQPDGYLQGDEIIVQVTWPDDTSVLVSASTRYDADHPALAAIPLTKAQVRALALNPALRD